MPRMPEKKFQQSASFTIFLAYLTQNKYIYRILATFNSNFFQVKNSDMLTIAITINFRKAYIPSPTHVILH